MQIKPVRFNGGMTKLRFFKDRVHSYINGVWNTEPLCKTSDVKVIEALIEDNGIIFISECDGKLWYMDHTLDNPLPLMQKVLLTRPNRKEIIWLG